MMLFLESFSAVVQWNQASAAMYFIACGVVSSVRAPPSIPQDRVPSVSKLSLQIRCCPLRPGREEPGGSLLSFASPKESNQRSRTGDSLTSRSEVRRIPKGDPQSGAPLGQPSKWAETGGPRKLGYRLKQRAALIRFAVCSLPPLLGSGEQYKQTHALYRCHPGLDPGSIPAFGRRQAGSWIAGLAGNDRLSKFAFSPKALPGWAVDKAGKLIKVLDVRRLRIRQVSKISVSCEHCKALVAKRGDPDCGSPFFSLGFFGDAKTKCLALRRETRPLRGGQPVQITDKAPIRYVTCPEASKDQPEPRCRPRYATYPGLRYRRISPNGKKIGAICGHSSGKGP